MPAFEAVHQAFSPEVGFVGMAVPPDLEGARAIVERTGVTYPTYADPQGVGPSYFESVSMPTTVFLSPSGDVLEVSSRPMTEAQLLDAVEQHYDLG